MRCSHVARFFSHSFSTSALRQPAEARMSEARQKAPLLRTPLHKFHLERGARLVAFAGYEMPVQYPTGILTEHLHTRADAVLFVIKHIGQPCKIELLPDRVLVAVHGPLAEAALARLTPAITAMRFMEVRTVRILSADCEVSRSGYTGEDGFEISILADRVEALARAL